MTKLDYDYSPLQEIDVRVITDDTTAQTSQCKCGTVFSGVSHSPEGTRRLIRRKFREHIRSRTQQHREWEASLT
jgi:hypothetical protein